MQLPKVLLVLAALVCIFYTKVIFAPSHQMIGWEQSDTREQYFQWRRYGFEELKEGRLPFWNRYAYCGMPFLANVQTALFYPPNAIFLAMNTARAINWSFIIHALIAAAGVALFLRRLGVAGYAQACGAATFAFSAPFLCQIAVGHLTLINTIAWTGFIFWAIRRAYEKPSAGSAATIAAFTALALLAGNTHNFFYLTIAAGLYAVFLATQRLTEKQPRNAALFLFCFAGGMALAAGICALQLLPALEMGSLAARQGATYEFCSTYSFPPENIVTFLMPEFFGNTFHTPYWGRFCSWEMCAYAGIVPLALACIACGGLGKNPNRATVIFFGCCALAFFVLALGGYTPLFRLLYAYVPGFSLFRGNSKFLFLVSFSISILAGFGAERFRANTYRAGTTDALHDDPLRRARKKYLWVAGTVTAALAACFCCAPAGDYRLWGKLLVWMINLPFNNMDAFSGLPRQSVMHASFAQALSQFVRFAGVVACLGALLCIRRKKVRTYLLFPLLLADLWGFGSKYLLMTDSRTIGIDNGPLSYMSREATPFRVLTPGMPRNNSMVNRIENAEGYDPIVLKDYYDYAAFSQGTSASELMKLLQSTVPLFSLNKFTGLLNLKYLLLPAGFPFKADPAFVEEAYRDDNNVLLRLRHATERFLFVNDIKVVPHGETLATMAEPSFNLFKAACIEGTPPFSLSADTMPVAQVTLRNYGSATIALDIQAETDGLLVMLDAFYPAWKATVDGIGQEIYRTDFLFRGVFVRKGKHLVEMRYDPASFRTGRAVSIVSILLACAAALLIRIRRGRSEELR